MHASSGASDSYRPVVIGYYGCTRELGLKVLHGQEYPNPSTNVYDWLGHGLYFWENDYDRAWDWARTRCKGKEPFVLGAFINLGRCLNLLEQSSLSLLPPAYETLQKAVRKAGRRMPQNEKRAPGGEYRKRDLDCAVLNTLHQSLKEDGKPSFDTVRGAFWGRGEAVSWGRFSREESYSAVRQKSPFHSGFLPSIKGEPIPALDNLDRQRSRSPIDGAVRTRYTRDSYGNEGPGAWVSLASGL